MVLMDAMPTSGRIQNSEAFQTTSASQESKGNLASARLHTSFEEDWGGHHKICLGSVPYSPDLPLSCFNLFGALKDAILSTKFETDEYVMSAAINWLREQGRAGHRTDKACIHQPLVEKDFVKR